MHAVHALDFPELLNLLDAELDALFGPLAAFAIRSMMASGMVMPGTFSAM